MTFHPRFPPVRFHRGDTVKAEVGIWGTDRIRVTIPCCDAEVHPLRQFYDHDAWAETGLAVKCPVCKWTWKLIKISDTQSTLKA